MKLASKKSAAADTPAKRVSVIKLSAPVRQRIAKELGIQAGIDAVPEAIHVVRVNRQNLLTRPGFPHVWVLDIP